MALSCVKITSFKKTTMINASIITIGDELLIGQVIDTNSAWMAQQLNMAGINLRRRVAVGDNRIDIIEALDEEKKLSDIILITGGLGPTSDDITKTVLCEYFSGKMIMHEESLAHIKHLFETVLKRPMIDSNLKQAEVPDNCTVIFNTRGTAPGMWFEENGKIFVSMPGVPHEMKGMMETVVPELKKQFTFPHIAHRTLLTIGVGESYLADLIREFEVALPPHIKLAYLPNFGQVRLRLSSAGNNKNLIIEELNTFFIDLQQRVKECMVTNEDITFVEVISNLLIEKKKTVCTAESCTGGYLAHLLTTIPGSSAYFEGSLVSYSYKAKENMLQVSHSDLELHGAVSEIVVRQMAVGALHNFKTNYAIAVSGIMGPGGGMPGKPVGTVWIAVGNNSKLESRKFNLRFDRQKNIDITAINALNMLREFILSE